MATSDASRTVRIKFDGDARGLDRAGKQAARSMGETERGFVRLQSRLGQFRAGLGQSIKAGTALLIGAGLTAAKGFVDALDVGATRSKLQAQLDLTGAQADAAGKTAGKLYRAGFGDSVADVSGAIRQVVTNIDGLRNASQADLQAITGYALSLASAFDLDVADSTRAVAQLIRTGLAPNAKAAFDLITKGEQVGADKAGDLLDTFNEYGTQLRKLGIDGPKALGLINQGLKAGARDSDIVADALKEFSIRAVDGSALTAQGFKALGLDARKMAEQIGHGGKGAADALDVVLARLRSIPDPVKRSQAAVALFGTQAEDLGNALFALDPSRAVATLGAVAGAADKMGKTLSDNDKARLQSFKRTLQVGLAGALANLIKGFDTGASKAPGWAGALQTVGAALKSLWQWVSDNRDNFAKFGLIVGQILLVFGGTALKVIGGVIGAIGTLIGIWGFLLDKVLDVFGAIVHGAAAAFGWIPGLGGKLKDARDSFDRFHATVNNTLTTAANQARTAGQKLTDLGDQALGAAGKVSKIRDQLGKLPPTTHIRVVFDTSVTGPGRGALSRPGVLVGGFGHGGRVPNLPGSIPGRDSVPAMLTPGEIVLNQAQQQELRRLLALGPAAAGGAELAGVEQRVTVELVSRDPLMQSLLALVDARVTSSARSAVAGAVAGTGRRRL